MDLMGTHVLEVVGLALAAVLSAAAAILVLTRQRPLAGASPKRQPLSEPRSGRASARLRFLRSAEVAPESATASVEDITSFAPFGFERCTIDCRRMGRRARFEAIQVDDNGHRTRLAASPRFAIGRRRSVRATGEAQAMHSTLERYLTGLGWEVEERSGERWYDVALRRPREREASLPSARPDMGWLAPELSATGVALEPADADESAAESGRRRELKAFTGLTMVQFLQLGASLVTAPLIARALGADGRGLLAAVAVPLGIAPFLLQFGLGAYAINGAARGLSPRVVFGSLALPTLVLGGMTALAAPFIAGVLSHGHEPVDQLLIVGLLLMPVGLIANLAMNIAHGLSDWKVLTWVRALPPLVVFVGIVALFAAGALTVESAAIVTIVSGLAPLLALGSIFRRCLPPKVDLRMIRDGVSFGARAWVGTLATLANQRLDQLLMIPLVPPRQLGLYAVAVTISSISGLLSGQMVTVLIPRIADGQNHLVPQAMRCLLLVVTATAVVIAAATMLLLVPVFGSDFAAAKPLVLVLLVAVIPLSGLYALGQWLPAANRPGAPSMGELVSLVITVVGLILFLPSMGAMGAALVSLVAYSTTFSILLVIMARHLGQRIVDYLLPRPSDVARIVALARALPLPGRRTAA